MIVAFRGQDYTLQRLIALHRRARQGRCRRPGRPPRRGTTDRQEIEKLFEQMLVLRQVMARNADCPDFRAYTWKAYSRFDYPPEDCLAFADAVEKTCVPLVERLDDQRRHALGLSLLRPWDLAVDPRHRPPLRPFARSDRRFVGAPTTAFDRVSPDLGQRFLPSSPGERGLGQPQGQAPGGYQSSLKRLARAVHLHERRGAAAGCGDDAARGWTRLPLPGGAEEPLVFLSPPLEFCEVASMSMELLGADHLDVFYGDDAPGRANAAPPSAFTWKGLCASSRGSPRSTASSMAHTHPGHAPRSGPRRGWRFAVALAVG